MPIYPGGGGVSTGGGTGGAGGTVGIPNNIFGDTSGDVSQVPLLVNPAADRATAETTRDDYFTLNPGNLADYDANPTQGIYIYYIESGDVVTTFQVRVDGNWVDSTSSIGFPGVPGTDGDALFFESISARDTFFSDPGNLDLLKFELPIVVNSGNETATTFIWNGGTNPISYDADLWRPASTGSAPGSLVLGDDGSRISSGNKVINFTDPAGIEYIVQAVQVDSPNTPFYWDLGSESTASYTNVSDTNLADPQEVIITSPAINTSTYFTGLNVRPAATGTLRVEAWAGATDASPKILDFEVTFVGGDVGNFTALTFPNKVLLLSTDSTLFRFSNVQLQGGLQTVGPYTGQTVIDFQGVVRTSNSTDVVYQGIDEVLLQEGPGDIARVRIQDNFLDDKLILAYNNVAFNDEIDITSSVPVNWNAADQFNLSTTNDQIVFDATGISLALTPTNVCEVTTAQDGLNAGFQIQNTGSMGSTLRIIASTYDLDTQGGFQGTFAVSTHGGTAYAYLKQAVGGTYERILTTLDTGNVGPVHPGTVVTDELTKWTGTGNEITATTGFSHTPGGSLNELRFQSPSAAGQAIFIFTNDVGTPVAEINYSQVADNLIISANALELQITSSTNMIIDSGGQLDIRSDTGVLWWDDVNAINIDTETSNPNTSLSRQQGSIVYLKDGEDSDVLVNVSDTTGTDYASLRGIMKASMSRQASDGVCNQSVTSGGTELNCFASVHELTSPVLFPNLVTGGIGQRIDIDQVINTTQGDLYRVYFTASIASNKGTFYNFNWHVITNGTSVPSVEAPNLSEIEFFNDDTFQVITMTGLMRGPLTTTGISGIQMFVTKTSGTGTIYVKTAHMAIERVGG